MEAKVLLKFVVCLVPLLLLWGLSIILVRIKKGNFVNPLKKNNHLKLIENLPLTANNSLHLVKIGESKSLLLGVSSEKVDLLQVFDAGEFADLSLSEDKPASGFKKENLVERFILSKEMKN
jgi:flagellar biogenesis protein FliO